MVRSKAQGIEKSEISISQTDMMQPDLCCAPVRLVVLMR